MDDTADVAWRSSTPVTVRPRMSSQKRALDMYSCRRGMTVMSPRRERS